MTRRPEPHTPEALDDLERDPVVDSIRDAFDQTRAPDPGDAFFSSLSDDIMSAVAQPQTTPTPAATPTWRERLHDFFRSPLRAGAFATVAIATLLALWVGLQPGDPSAPSPSNTPNDPGAVADDTPDADLDLETDSATDTMASLDAAELEQLDGLLTTPLNLQNIQDDEDHNEALDDLDASTLAALDAELARAFPLAHEEHRP